MMSTFPGFGIRPAEDAELPIARLFFSRWYDEIASGAVRFYVAVSDQPYRIQGVAALFPISQPPTECAFRIDLEVAPSCRGRGVGRALLDTAIGLARTCDGDAIYTWRDINEKIGLHFLGPAGFKRFGSDLYFEAEIDRLIEVHRPLIERLRNRGKMPAEARVVPYREADPHQTARLNEAGVSVIPPGHYACTFAEKSDHNSRYRCSQALLVKEQLAALMVVGLDGDVGYIETGIVHPAFRGTWANSLLSAHTYDRMKLEGVRIIRFYCHEDNLNTIRLANRAGAKLVKQGIGYRLAL